jgi:hypothetical protein
MRDSNMKARRLNRKRLDRTVCSIIRWSRPPFARYDIDDRYAQIFICGRDSNERWSVLYRPTFHPNLIEPSLFNSGTSLGAGCWLPNRSPCRVQDAQKQTNIYRPNDNATPRARLDADTRAAQDANCGKASEDAATETAANKDRSSPRGQSENKPEELAAEAAGCSKGQHAALVPGVDFPVNVVKVRQPLHRQAVLVFFALDVPFHQMLGKPLARALGLGTVCKSAIDGQRAING